MAIRPRKGNLQIDVYAGGVRHRETFHGSMDAAKVREAVIKEALNKGELVPQATVSGSVYQTSSSALLLESALETIWDKYWSEGGSARTVRSDMKTCIEYFGADRDIRTITTHDADEFIAHLRSKGYAVSTIKGKCHPMIKMYTHFTRRGNVAKAPFFETPRAENNLRERVISQEEFDEVLRLLRDPYDFHHTRGDSPAGSDWADFFVFLWDTGVRPSEAARIKAKHVTNGQVYLAKTKTDNPRTIPLTEQALEAIERQIEQRGEFPFEWAHSQYSKAWNWCREQMGLGDDDGFIPYALRHTCATRLYDKTRDLMVVMRWLGHKNIQMTMRYAKLQPHDLANARDMLQEAA